MFTKTGLKKLKLLLNYLLTLHRGVETSRAHYNHLSFC